MNKKILLTAIALSAITATWAYAMYWSGQWIWFQFKKQNYTWWFHSNFTKIQIADNAPENIKAIFEKKQNWQMLSDEERQNLMNYMKEQWFNIAWNKKIKWYRQWKTMDTKTMLANIEKQDLSEKEKERLLYQYSEEMLARDIYNYFYSIYNIETFKNIANSENQHMNAVKTIIERYNLEIPTNYWDLQDEFEILKTEWKKWLKQALEVWVKIEILDIEDIIKTMKETDNNDIKLVFANIGWASYNHLKWFLNSLKINWFTTKIDYSAYIDQNYLYKRWPELKNNFVEKLKSEWINIHDQLKLNPIKWMRKNFNIKNFSYRR